MEIRRYTDCQVCGKSLNQPLTGRSRKYCSDACRQKAARAGKITQRTASMSGIETKLLQVWKNDHLRYRWFKTIQKYRPVLMDIVSRYDLPAELQAADHPVIEDAVGKMVYLPSPMINAVVDYAVAEMIHDYDDDAITTKLIGRRVKARLADAVRNSEEFSRLRITKPDGTVERVTRRRSFAAGLAESWLAAGRPAVEGAVTELVDRGIAVRTLEGDERIAYLALVLSLEPPYMLHGMITIPEVVPHWDELMVALAWAENIGSDDPNEDGLKGLLGFFGPDGQHRSGKEVRALVKGALERVSALTGQAPEEIISGIGRRPRQELEGFLGLPRRIHPTPSPMPADRVAEATVRG